LRHPVQQRCSFVNLPRQRWIINDRNRLDLCVIAGGGTEFILAVVANFDLDNSTHNLLFL